MADTSATTTPTTAPISANNGAPTTGTQAGDIAAGIISNNVYNPNIAASKITPTTPITTTPTTPQVDYNAILAGVTGAQNDVNTTEAQIEKDTTQLGQQSADQANFENQYGVTKDQQGLNDLNAQLTALNNEANAEKIKIGDQPIETSIVVGQQNQVEHERTIKALGISAQIQAMQGNLKLANDQVTRALALKYDPIKAEINTLNLQLKNNESKLSAAQKQQADAITAANNEKLKTIEATVANDKLFHTSVNQALANGMPATVANQAQQLYDNGDENGARALMSQYTGSKSNQVTGYDASGNPIYGSTSASNSNDTQKIISNFSSKLGSWNKKGTREQFIRELQAQFPNINPDQIAQSVYNTYPDNYNAQ